MSTTGYGYAPMTIEILSAIANALEGAGIAVPTQMRYNIISSGVGARQCRAPTGVPHVNENRYRTHLISTSGSRSIATSWIFPFSGRKRFC